MHYFLKMDVVDGMKHILGKIFDKQEWKQWIVKLDKIIMHPKYNRHGEILLVDSF